MTTRSEAWPQELRLDLVADIRRMVVLAGKDERASIALFHLLVDAYGLGLALVGTALAAAPDTEQDNADLRASGEQDWPHTACRSRTERVIPDVSRECVMASGYVRALQCTLDRLDGLAVDPVRTGRLRSQLWHVMVQLEQIAGLQAPSEEPLSASGSRSS